MVRIRQNPMYKNVAVVIPAYNESKNLKLLLPRIKKILPGSFVFVVDDSGESERKSIDSYVRTLSNGFLEVIHRSVKKGRGSAVLEGLRTALRNPRIQYFIEMDADLAHAPNECRFLLDAASEVDMVIGSRYLRNSIIVNWPMRRLIQSKIINHFLRLWLGLGITDHTNGFRVYNRPVVEFLTHTPLKETGFIALSETAYKIKKKGFTIKEVPITFTDRKFGKSNADIKELLVSLWGVMRLRLQK